MNVNLQLSNDVSFMNEQKQKYQIIKKPLQLLLRPVVTCLYTLNTILFKKNNLV